jgi:hypothetical protein
MPAGLRRYYGQGHLHFIIFSCHRRLPLLKVSKFNSAAQREEAMNRRLFVLAVVSIVAFSTSGSVRLVRSKGQDPCLQDHQDWVTRGLKKIETIKPGMTREELLEVFTTEGGFSTGLNRRFISRDCPYFKVDVEFKAVGRSERDNEGRVTLEEDPRDIIVKISQPYLQFGIAD